MPDLDETHLVVGRVVEVSFFARAAAALKAMLQLLWANKLALMCLCEGWCAN